MPSTTSSTSERGHSAVLGNGLVTSEGPFWRRQRKLVQPTFLKARVASYAPIMTEQTEQMLDPGRPANRSRSTMSLKRSPARLL